jgi:tetratricopeptide (TPR) repeat protein
MHTTPLLLVAVAIGIYLVVRVFTGNGTLARAIRATRIVNAVTAEYRAGNYEAALRKAERLKDGDRITAEYCFMTGSVLHHMGQFTEAEARLREGLPLEEDDRQKALVYNTLATVLMDQQRYPEAIAFFENAGRSWPERGANHRGIAEVWLRQRRELSESLDHARQAVDIDRGATGLKQEALNSRLGEDFAVLSWALAENSGSRAEVESHISEALRLCDKKTKATQAEVHYHIGRAYGALGAKQEAGEHICRAMELDSNGLWGKMAREFIGNLASD